MQKNCIQKKTFLMWFFDGNICNFLTSLHFEVSVQISIQTSEKRRDCTASTTAAKATTAATTTTTTTFDPIEVLQNVIAKYLQHIYKGRNSKIIKQKIFGSG